MYQIKKGEPLTTTELGAILLDFQSKQLPLLQKRKDYYDGKMAILNRTSGDTQRQMTNVVFPYCKTIADSFQGYICGGKAITYDNLDPELLSILLYNDEPASNVEFLGDALVYGRAYQLVYRDSWMNLAFRQCDPRTIFEIVDDTLDEEVQYVVRFWKTDLVDNQLNPTYTIEVYGKEDTKIYLSGAGFSSFTLMDTRPNYFEGNVPVVIFSLNREQKSIYEQVMGLNDAYNLLASNQLSDSNEFADAYLCLYNQILDAEQLEEMRRHRVLMLDSDGKAEYLVKQNNASEKEILDNLNSQIFAQAQCVDFSSESFYNASSGTALKMKLLNMENKASQIESQMRKALTQRLFILSSALNLLNGNDEAWSGVKITFTRNIPVIYAELADELNKLRNIVSTSTMLSLLPFVDSPEEEMEKLRKEKEEAMSTYGALFNEDSSEG